MSNKMLEKSNVDQTIRATDPDVLQRRAADPNGSVWVGASAGSGKTKVLTDRMLRLLLPDPKGHGATPPHKILAITFTKAGASEMTLRIQKTLSEWAIIEEEALIGKLKYLLGTPASTVQVTAARQLFAKVMDAPGSMQIMTLHSFCQSILGRFPLEAGLSPSFTLLEESQASALKTQAISKTIRNAQNQKGSPLSQALAHLATVHNEEQFQKLIGNFIGEQRQVQTIITKHFDIDGLYTALCQNLDIHAGQTPDDALHHFCENSEFDESALRKACAALSEGSIKKDQPRGIAIQEWLDANSKERAQGFETYKKQFLTTKNEARAKFATKAVEKTMPTVSEVMAEEAHRVLTLEESLKRIKTANATRDLFLIGTDILNHYQVIKEQQSALDFDDLILKTLGLFKGETVNNQNLSVMPWVRFKMDQGIDHVLVDEAQDTNPEQWEIIAALCDDFFDHHGGDNSQNTERTLFVVGDEKQSIFSFQRASPEKFSTMRDFFKEKITSAAKTFDPIQFNISFRSAPTILDFVDHVFEGGLSNNPVTHESHRRKQAGSVALWPLFKPSKTIERDPWSPPTEIINSSTGASQMAEHIGQTIQTWINEKKPLESYDRAIEPQDILILVRSRTAFLDQLIRALKTRDIPVSGVDRMVLGEQLVVQDMMAAINFALLPEDDLNLAALLKSPFIGWNEEQLFDSAHKRPGSLWQAIKNSGDTETIQWLTDLIHQAGSVRAYEFMARILQQQCPAANSGIQGIKTRLGEEALDPLDEFLNYALSFETDHIPTLQNFVKAQATSTTEIKRQMEEAGNAVRIMTVHAAKGLQAPIVILPDTIRSPSSAKAEKILWPDKTGQTLPYFCAVTQDMPEQVTPARELLKQREQEEYQRLLYVALTRAENQLYIGGYLSQKKPLDNSWYHQCQSAFEKHPDTIEAEGVLTLSNPMIGEPDKKQNGASQKKDKIETPAWLFQAIPEEPSPPRPLVPSRPSGDDVPTLSPLQSDNQKRFLRGNVTHKLLQTLPDLPQNQWENAAQKYVSLPAHGLSQKIQDSIVRETLAVLNHPEFSTIFEEGSIAEAPITGLINGNQLVSGQIDRLRVTETEILIIDYKTNRPPPTKAEDIPAIYKRQMQSYRDIMAEIYPNHIIKTALIWTDGPSLMVIES